MEKTKIYYSKNSYDNIINKIRQNKSYNIKEKEQLILIMKELKNINYLLYSIEILKENDISTEVDNFSKYRAYLIEEIYHEIYRQLLEKYRDYEEVCYSDIRKYFNGMTFNIRIINNIDSLFKDNNIKIKY
ncbi:MAG: hypothetical protein IJA94_04225 [Bacilli bacterium]|nr:hypothetical protein [Bacilli bacterium]